MNLVRELTVTEIMKENSLILVTIPMTGSFSHFVSVYFQKVESHLGDMEVQTAVRLAREVDPEGLRTIGMPA